MIIQNKSSRTMLFIFSKTQNNNTTLAPYLMFSYPLTLHRQGQDHEYPQPNCQEVYILYELDFTIKLYIVT